MISVEWFGLRMFFLDQVISGVRYMVVFILWFTFSSLFLFMIITMIFF